MNKSLVLVFVACVAAGCESSDVGSGDKQTLTCDQNAVLLDGVYLNQCMELSAPKSVDLYAQCAAVSGSPSFNPCRTYGAIGICEGVSLQKIDARIVLFADQLVSSVEGALSKCNNLGGTFSALAPPDMTRHSDQCPKEDPLRTKGECDKSTNPIECGDCVGSEVCQYEHDGSSVATNCWCENGARFCEVAYL